MNLYRLSNICIDNALLNSRDADTIELEMNVKNYYIMGKEEI